VRRQAAVAVLLAILCLGNTAARAQNDDWFQIGRRAFESGDYPAAIMAFETAVAAGQAGPAVHFNIGVAAYRAGDYTRAQTAFGQVAQFPAMAALAHYNLGLVALRRADSSAAVRWFSQVQREAEDERLRSLAAARLVELRTPPPGQSWAGYASLTAGYDDNVALLAQSDTLQASGSADGFAELQLFASTASTSTWQFDGGLYLVDYQDLDRFDQLGLQAGGGYRFDFGRWRNQAQAQLAYSTLDGHGLENLQALALQSTTALGSRWQLQARYRFSNFDGLSDFSSLTGRRHEIDLGTRWRDGAWGAAVGYQFDLTERADDMLSATRHRLTAQLTRALPMAWQISIEAVQRHTRYELRSNGTERLLEFSAAATKAWSQHWRFTVRYTHADNDAAVPSFDYQRNRIVAGIEALL